MYIIYFISSSIITFVLGYWCGKHYRLVSVNPKKYQELKDKVGHTLHPNKSKVQFFSPSKKLEQEKMMNSLNSLNVFGKESF